MKTNLKSMLLCCTFILGIVSNAYAKDSSASLDVVGSTKEYVELERDVMKTLYRKEAYQGTCYNRETYTERVCGNETRYKQECSTIPGRNHCYTDYERQCRTVYEQECSTVFERECRTIPGEVRCHIAANGERKCEKIPMREQCENVPRNQCRQVQRQQCENVPRQRCEWIPPTQSCQNVPYQEYVCNNVERYRDIPYSCTQYRDVPYQVRDQLVIARVNFESSMLRDSDTRFKVNFEIGKDKELKITATNVVTNKPIILRVKKSQKNGVNGDVKTIEASYVVTEERAVSSSVLNNVKVSWVSLTRQRMTIALDKEIDFSKVSKIATRITKDNVTYMDTSLQAQDFNVSKRNGMTYAVVNLLEHGGRELDGVINKKFKVVLELSENIQIQNQESVLFENVTSQAIGKVKMETVVKRD